MDLEFCFLRQKLKLCNQTKVMISADFSSQVNVLLSTYNGEAYLLEQLQSLYQQTYPNTKIIVRDDGSTDSTLNLLLREASLGKLTLLPQGGNIGPATSFFKLLETSGNADFYALCDQDDIWVSNKIELAVKAIKQLPSEIPVMYFSRLMYVDSKNQFIKLSALPSSIGFGNALVENVATGCTVVLNKAARDLIVKNIPSQCVMHDSWCYLIISCLGQVIYDPFPSIRYRQHVANAIGASLSVMDTIKRRIKRFKFQKDGVFRFSNQAETLFALYENQIASENRTILKQFVNAKESLPRRLMLALSRYIWRQGFVDNLILRVLILLNRY